MTNTMSCRGKLCVIVFALLFVSLSLALGIEDPELKTCQHQCEAQRQYPEKQRELCTRKCEDYVREKHRRERGGGSHSGGWGDDAKNWWRRGRGSDRMNEMIERQLEDEEHEEEHQQQKTEKNPYVFEDRHFFTGMRTQHGRVRILQQFKDRSKLLRGIQNYRVMIVEAEPQTFLPPSHFDAEVVLFVARGKGSVTFLRNDRRESFNIGEGDVVRIRAGTPGYFINRDSNERLVLVELIQPVSTPGEFQAFYGAGGENPESFYSAFSDEILEAAFNTTGERLRRIFREQNQGAIIKASEEQIRALSHHEHGGIWPFGGGESKGLINIYQQRPTQSNQYGQLYEVNSRDFRQLRDLDVSISLLNLSQGAMVAPHFNSKATKISVVVDGEGYFEMACPHMSRSQNHHHQRGEKTVSGGTPSYQKISSRLRRGTVVIVPAGHPFVAVASNNQNLQLLCFEVNASNNEKFHLAGRRNVMNQMEREAKELAFGIPATEVEEIFQMQQEEFFFPGPQQRREGRADA